MNHFRSRCDAGTGGHRLLSGIATRCNQAEHREATGRENTGLQSMTMVPNTFFNLDRILFEMKISQ
jgi:hypothetical protein